MNLVPCAGCGILAESHPMVCVVNPSDKDTMMAEGVPTSVAGPRGFVAVEVCDECWKHPDHRKRPLKGHFFHKQDAPTALFHAGSNSQVGGQ
jgi:hypothetical protein